MLAEISSRAIEFATGLLAGGTFEIVVLCILLVLGLILLVILLFVAWKLLVLLGKGLLWGAKTGGGATKNARARASERRLAAPPPVAAGWRNESKSGLRATVREARRIAGPDGLWIMVVAGTGYPDLCRSLSLPVPPGAMIGITASDGIVLVDATRGTARDLRRLGQMLPSRRPFDAIAVLVNNEEIPAEAMARANTLAKAGEMRAALHLVLSTEHSIPAWRTVEPGGEAANELCSGLAAEAARTWLGGGQRAGLEVLSRVQSRGLAETIANFIAAAPRTAVDIASLSLGGEGLARAAARCAGRTRPASVPGAWTWVGLAGAAAGTVLAMMAILDSFMQGKTLEGVVKSAARETRSAWTVEGVNTLPTSTRTYRMVTLADRLTSYSELDMLIPAKVLIPERGAPRELASALLEGYVLRPLSAAIEARSTEILKPRHEAQEWLEDAKRVDEWLAAWEGLEEEPEQVDLAQFLSEFFGDEEGEWPERPERVLLATGGRLPTPEHGGLDPGEVRELARASFVQTMEHWADSVYTNGPVAQAARAVGKAGVPWTARYTALNDLRSALEDPGPSLDHGGKGQTRLPVRSTDIWTIGGNGSVGTNGHHRSESRGKQNPNRGTRGSRNLLRPRTGTHPVTGGTGGTRIGFRSLARDDASVGSMARTPGSVRARRIQGSADQPGGDMGSSGRRFDRCKSGESSARVAVGIRPDRDRPAGGAPVSSAAGHVGGSGSERRPRSGGDAVAGDPGAPGTAVTRNRDGLGSSSARAHNRFAH